MFYNDFADRIKDRLGVEIGPFTEWTQPMFFSSCSSHIFWAEEYDKCIHKDFEDRIKDRLG